MNAHYLILMNVLAVYLVLHVYMYVYACGAREGPCYQSYYNKRTHHIMWHISVVVVYSYLLLKRGFIQDFHLGGQKRRLPNEGGQGQ